jgi:hypothetical protein
MDSIQRQNARNRRVPGGVIRRVSNFLSSAMMSAVNDSPEHVFEQRHLTECVIGVPLSVSCFDFLCCCLPFYCCNSSHTSASICARIFSRKV